MPQPTPPLIPALPDGHRLDGYQLRRLTGASSTALSYLATDLELGLTVVVTEYFPAAIARRGSDGQVDMAEPQQAAVYQRGLKAFADEARMLARCQHPSLASVLRLWHGHGTAYRVMPYREGQSLLDLRREMPGPPDEASLLALMDDLLEALDIVHRSGHAHGGVHPGNILLLADDRPLLLAPDWAATALAQTPAAAPSATDDLSALSEVVRFCMTGSLTATSTGARFGQDARQRYGEPLMRTLDAATSGRVRDRPVDVAQYRVWLADGPPLRFSPPTPAPAPASDDANAFLTAEFLGRLNEAIGEVPAARSPHARLEPTLIDDDPTPSEALAVEAEPFEAPPRVIPAAPPKRRPLVFTAVSLAILAAVGVGLWQAGVVDVPGAQDWQLSHLMKHKQRAGSLDTAPAGRARRGAEVPVAKTMAPPAAVATAMPLPIEPTSAGSAPTEVATATAPPVKRVKAAPGTPRSACGQRTEFALYRCVQTQCGQKRWQGHAQCEALKRG